MVPLLLTCLKDGTGCATRAGKLAKPVGLDLSVLREVLRRQSELISTAGQENMMKPQRKWEDCWDRVEDKVTAQDEVVRQLSMRC